MGTVRLISRSGLVAGMLGLLASAPAGATDCARPQELQALNARVLQTELMVAALSCGHQAGYNAFVGSFRNDLVKQGGTLRAYFHRQYGAQGQARLDRFITQLANQESGRSNVDRLAFCAATALQFQRLSGAERMNLERVVDGTELALRHGIPVCTGEIGTQALRQE